MSDDLVRRLRLRHPQGRPPHSIGLLLEVLHAERDEAADRIEQLEAENARLSTAALDAICPVGERRVVDRTPQPCPTCGGLDPTDYINDPPHTLCPSCGGRGTVDGDRIHGLDEWRSPSGLFRLVDESEAR